MQKVTIMRLTKKQKAKIIKIVKSNINTTIDNKVLWEMWDEIEKVLRN